MKTCRMALSRCTKMCYSTNFSFCCVQGWFCALYFVAGIYFVAGLQQRTCCQKSKEFAVVSFFRKNSKRQIQNSGLIFLWTLVH